MKPIKVYHISDRHSIEIKPASWNPEETSVRSRRNLPNGKFDRVSSSELPIPNVELVVKACAENGCFDPGQAARMIEVLSASLSRQLGS